MKTWYSTTVTNGLDGFSLDFLNGELSYTFTQNDEISQLLEDLNLLKHVPMGGLVPDESMLPEESLRLFCLDPNWVNALLDGALSIGRSCTADEIHDSAISENLDSSGFANSAGSRLSQYGRSVDSPNTEGVRMGFLLNSKLVKGWPGLEVHCFYNEQEQNILRLERIGNSIMLCIVEGQINEIILTEPLESLYFSFEKMDDDYGKKLVFLDPKKVGKNCKSKQKLIYRNKDKKLLNILEMATSMQAKLEKEEKREIEYFSSLEFAVQMLHGRTQLIAKISLKDGN